MSLCYVDGGHCGCNDGRDCAALARLRAENAELRAEIARLESASQALLEHANECDEAAVQAEAREAELRADAERYRFWRKFYDCRFALKLGPLGSRLALSFLPARPDVEVSPDYENLVDAALDAARAAESTPDKGEA